MYALIVMAISLTLFVSMLYKKIRIGLSMLAATTLLSALLKVSPLNIYNYIIFEFHDDSLALTQTTTYLFISLTALLLGVNVIGAIMQQTGISTRLIPAIQGLFRSRRVAMAVIPMIMGMLPTPGGIMLSAPMVRDLGDQIGVKRSQQAAINFFFRHQWESVWPLFPAVPLVQSILAVSAFTVISHNIIISVFGILGGIIFLLIIGIPPKNKDLTPEKRCFHHNIRDFIHAFWPIIFTAILFAGFNIPPAIGIITSIFGLLILHKVPRKRWGKLFNAAKEPDLVLLVLSALLFKLILQAGGAIPDVVNFFTQANLPPVLIVFLLPFLVAFMSGVTMPTIAITFPFLTAFTGTGPETNMPLATLAFAGVMCGLFITPVHLCLPLSAAYFQTPLSKLIAKLSLPAIFVTACVTITVMLLL